MGLVSRSQSLLATAFARASMNAPDEALDVVSVARAAQALSREIELVKLVDTLMRIALAHGGAERGLLILPQDDGFRIAAEASVGHDEAVVVTVAAASQLATLAAPGNGGKSRTPPEYPEALPTSLLRHVAQTRETLVIDDAAALDPRNPHNPFPADPYLGSRQSRSILCIPLLRQAALGGILYLENRQIPHAFTAQRIAVLELLASQAMVSLENAKLCAEILRESNERKRAEAALSANGARFVAILDSALEAIVAIGVDQRIVYFNAAAEQMFGWPAAEVVGGPLDRLIPAHFLAAHREHVRRFADSGTTRRVMGVPLEVRGVRRNGEEFPVDAAISQGECGGQKLLTVMLRDITERKRVAEELRLHREHLEELVSERTAELTTLKEHLATELTDLKRLHELSSRLLAENDPAALLHEVLQAAMALLGATKGKLQLYDPRENALRIVAQIGFNQDFVDTFKSVQPFVAICGTAMGMQQRVVVEDILSDPRFADDRELYLANEVAAMQSTPLYGIDGQSYGVLTTHFRTPHRPSERELRLLDLYAQQATRVIESSERTAQLALAKRKAEEADRLKSVFLTTMSHELRTPLNAILGYAQILARDPGIDERQADGLNTIRQSGEYLLSLINDILDLSKIEAGRLELNPGPVSLPLFLQSVAEIIAIRAEQKGLAFTFEAPPELPDVAVVADEKRLRQVLLNLLGNAVKFTERGEVSLRVHSLPATDAQARLRFEIRDTGIGIAAEALEAIFQPFEQFGALQQRAGGTGLGLTISRQLVRLMASDIHVESRPGEGSLFWFELNVTLSGDAETAVRRTPRAVTGYHGTRRKILIADDVLANRRVLADFLGSLGFAVCEASDGREAVAQAEAERPDLILMDVMMPLLDGPEATRRIRAIPGCEMLPVFAVSANKSGDMSGDDAERHAAGGAS
ncbi:MAG: ATP-binding protein, partial [Rhodocyclaceae bacterium]